MVELLIPRFGVGTGVQTSSTLTPWGWVHLLRTAVLCSSWGQHPDNSDECSLFVKVQAWAGKMLFDTR